MCSRVVTRLENVDDRNPQISVEQASGQPGLSASKACVCDVSRSDREPQGLNPHAVRQAACGWIKIPSHKARFVLQEFISPCYGEVWPARNATGSMSAVEIGHRISFDHDWRYQCEFDELKKLPDVIR